MEDLQRQIGTPGLADRDEVTAGIGLLLGGLLESMEVKAQELHTAEDPGLIEAASNLINRITILSDGLRPKPKRSKLHELQENLKDDFGSAIFAVDAHVDTRLRLLNSIDIIGAVIQRHVVESNLLTAKAKRQLSEIYGPVENKRYAER